MMVAHPDTGGTVGMATMLNRAIAQVRAGETVRQRRPTSRPAHPQPVSDVATAWGDWGQWNRSAPPPPRRRKVPRRFAWLVVLCVVLVLLVTYWQVIAFGIGALWAVAAVMGKVTE